MALIQEHVHRQRHDTLVVRVGERYRYTYPSRGIHEIVTVTGIDADDTGLDQYSMPYRAVKITAKRADRSIETVKLGKLRSLAPKAERRTVVPASQQGNGLRMESVHSYASYVGKRSFLTMPTQAAYHFAILLSRCGIQ